MEISEGFTPTWQDFSKFAADNYDSGQTVNIFV